MAKQLLTPLRFIARMNFSLKNYSGELFGKVELISTRAVCESWNVSDKYTWDNAGDLNPISTGGGGGGCFPPPNLIFACNFFILEPITPKLVINLI